MAGGDLSTSPRQGAAPAVGKTLEEGGVSYESLQDLLRAERRSNKLMPLPTRFWAETKGFLERVTDAFRAEQAKDPFGRRVMLLTDEVKNARHAAQSLWALRERKLAMLALAQQPGAKKPDGLLPDEGQLYNGLLGVLDETRNRVLEGMFGPVAPGGNGTSAPTPSAPAPQAPPQVTLETPPTIAAAPPLQMPVTAPVQAVPITVPHDTKAAAGTDLVTIRALGDIPPFVGPDMQTYLLKEGDIATVPKSIASLLEKRKKAAIIEMG